MLVSLMILVFAGGDLSLKGEIASESRFFDDDNWQVTQDINSGLFGRLDLSYGSGPWKTALRGYGRWDATDSDRNFASFEEAWVAYRTSKWHFRAGYQMLNWSATEAFHPADSINARNWDSRVENPEKRGEPMVSLARQMARGELTAYWMSFSTPNHMPSQASRLNFAAGQAWSGTRYLDHDGSLSKSERSNQWGLRYTVNIGDGDLALHYLDHRERQQFGVAFDTSTNSLHPLLFEVREWGLTHQHVIDAWVLKIEAAYKDYPRQDLAPGILDQTQTAFGVEYGWITGSGASATVLFEGQTLLGLNKTNRAAASLFQRDVLLGYRHAFNDIKSREVLVSLIVDLERQTELLFNAQYAQRINDVFSLTIGLRWIDAKNDIKDGQGLLPLDQADQCSLTVTRHF